jgi:Cu+-exporting ATPase
MPPMEIRMNALSEPRRNGVEQITLSIHGMTCAGCVATVERALKSVPGVRQAQVNLATEEGRVSTAGDGVDVAALVRAVERAGYRAAPRADTHRVDRDRERILEERANRRRLAIALTFGIPLMLAHQFVHNEETRRWIAFALATPVQFVAAWPFHVRTARGLSHGVLDMNTLITLGTFSAYLFSAAITLAPRFFESLGLGTHDYFDTAVMILAFILLGRLLESRARRRTGDAVRALLTRRPQTARRVTGSGTESVPVEALRRDDRIEILPGETFPVDALVEEGRTEVDEAMLTGEPAPVVRGPGDPVAAGTINLTGRVVLSATRVGEATTLARIVRLVEDAQGSKAPAQALADRVAGRFVPAVVAIALLSSAAWLAWGPAPTPRYAMLVFVSVLIIACPCAMGLATPTAIMVGTGAGARRGILIRGGDSLERAGRVTAIVFDKTGTLTLGEPRVVGIHSAEGIAPMELLGVAAAVERGSEHPHARAIVRRAAENGVAVGRVADVTAVPGQGARGRVDDAEVRVGSRAFACPLGASPEPLGRLAESAADLGRTAIWVARGRQVLGLLETEDRLRDDAAAAVARLGRTVGTLVLATGDREKPARRLAAAVGISDVRAGLSPEGKVALVRELQARGEVVAMVGDGLNDAAAIAAADLGIAIGSGTDVAIEAADVTLVKGSLALIGDALDLSRRTVQTIRQNLFWAFAYNVLAIPVAAGALFPVWGILLHPTIASAAMAMSSVSVVSNSLRLARWPGAPA